MTEKSGIAKRREEVRNQHWPNEDLWTGEKEKGWFPVPRSLPLLMALLASKELSDRKDPSSVYLELLSRQRGEGVVEMGIEADHAFAAGYVGSRAIRTWQERFRILEKEGFIQAVRAGNRIKYVAVIHPTIAVQRLRVAKRISNDWWNAYHASKLETKEPTFEQREKKRADERKVVSIGSSSKTAKSKKSTKVS